MKIERILYHLAEKYGDEFNWRIIASIESQGAFVDELRRELGDDDKIFQSSLSVVAKCDSNDDVLFSLRDERNGELWRVYHLTYTANNAPGFPRYEEFTSEEAVGQWIEHQFLR